MVDARLTDGSRVNAIVPPLSLDGPMLSIRRFAAGGSWGVQVGAFHNPSPAQRAAALVAQRFPKLLGEAEIVTPHIESQSGRIYRARLIGMSKDAARDACRKLKSARVDCLVVQASATVEVALNKASGG